MNVRFSPHAKILLSAVFLSLAWFQAAGAVMPTQEVLERLRREGTFDDYVQVTENARRRGMDSPDPARLAGQLPPVVGTKRALVILVDFSDHTASAGAVTDTTYFKNLLFSVNAPAKSLTDFYAQNSYGKVTVTGDVVGWLRMPQTYRYYAGPASACNRGLGSPPRNAQKLAEDALLAAAAQTSINFADYDNDNDGQMDGFFVVHAGPGYEETGDLCDIHSHKWSLTTPLTLDGVTISNYTMQPEEQGNGNPVNIGVFCHEFGHFFGLPDLYDTDGSSQGLDKWSLMSAGNYARADGSSPCHFDAWCKIQLGWITPVNVSTNMLNAPLPQVETDSTVYRLWTGGAGGSQYYLVENRQRVLFDFYLPAGGLLIYRVDENLVGLSPNDNEWYPGHTSFGHYKIALRQADGLWELEKSTGNGPLVADNGDPWPGSSVHTAFDDASTPDSRDYNGASTQVAVWNISAPSASMTANLDITWSRPNFRLVDLTFNDDGDHDGTADPGEAAELYVTHVNDWKAVASSELHIACDDTDLVFSDTVVNLGAVASGDTSVNALPIQFSVPAGKRPRITDFYITVVAEGGSYSMTDTVPVDIGPKQILLVDDDARLSPAPSHDSVYILPVMKERRDPFDRWDVYDQGTPSVMQNYPVVIWYTGDYRSQLFGASDSLISPSEAAAIRAYLNAGGRLFITGQQIAHYLDSMDQALLTDYLHGTYAGSADDVFAFGIDGDPVGDSTKYVLAGPGGAANQLSKDLLTPVGSAVPVFTETAPENITGVRFDSSYKVVFLGWGVEGIGDDVMGLDAWPKEVLINRALNWLMETGTDVTGHEADVRPESFELIQNFPNPFNPSTTIEFVRTGKPAPMELSVYNLLGQRIRLLASGTFAAGRHQVAWNGRDERDRAVATGVYFYRLESADQTETRKMLLLK